MPTDISTESRNTIKQRSIENRTYEICGVIYDNTTANTQHIFFVNNISEEPETYFLFDPLQLSQIETSIELDSDLEFNAYFHSHVNSTEQPSTQDLMMINRSNKRMLIYSIYTDRFSLTEPSGEEYPLVGRPFNWAEANCYTLIQDYYMAVRSIELSDYSFTPNWWKKGQNLFLDNITTEGFIAVNTLREHDVILMQIDSPVPNHLGIYLNSNKMLHHPLDKELYMVDTGKNILGIFIDEHDNYYFAWIFTRKVW